MMYGQWHDGYGWAMFAVNLLVWLAVIGLVSWAVLALTRGNTQRSDVGDGRGSRALSILEERYARGEITEDEYRRRREVLVH